MTVCGVRVVARAVRGTESAMVVLVNDKARSLMLVALELVLVLQLLLSVSVVAMVD